MGFVGLIGVVSMIPLLDLGAGVPMQLQVLIWPSSVL